ncbi:MAG: hypothetical protein R2706_00355 [Acidimicrobiales bacterium]
MTSPTTAIYQLVLRHQINRNRVIVMGVTLGLFLVVSVLVATNEGADGETMVQILAALGLSIAVPILSLVLASAAIGEWVEDETLVYIWLRPISKLKIAAAATAACLTVSLPATVLTTMVSAAIGSKFDLDTIVGAAVSTTIATLAYTSIFVALGALTRWALISGFVYIFVWESLIARFGDGLARLSIRSYAASALQDFTKISIDLGNRSSWAVYVIPLVITVAGIGLTTLILERKDVP